MALFEHFGMDRGIDRFRMITFSDFEAELRQAVLDYEPKVQLGLVERLNLFLATTVRLNWKDLQDIIGAIMVQLLGGNDG